MSKLLVLSPLGFIVQTISYMAERVVGQGSFGIVFQVMSALQILVIYEEKETLIIGRLTRLEFHVSLCRLNA